MAFRTRHRPRILEHPLTRRARDTQGGLPQSDLDTNEVGQSAGAAYDRAYFDRWYRQPSTRVKSPTELRRQVDFVLHTAEWALGHRVRSVLDVGCGEGNWQPLLRAARPRVHYDGVDPSEYAVRKFGKRRRVQLGSIDALDALPLRGTYDLVVCCGMLNYLTTRSLSDGLAQVSKRTGGVAYLELFADGDEAEGDTSWPAPRPASWYRREIMQSGLKPIGMQCYVSERAAVNISRLEQAW